MREVNFSIPNANKASVGITTALYDRRALDCTSTLPLINSLNHLAYLTTSSARIREILTIDGGVERLVCILKNGRSKELMDTWKWNLAFQCVVNIGVRGSDVRGPDSRASENIRTRVVEADMVPVIATILDNYMQVVEKLRARESDAEIRQSCSRSKSSKRPTVEADSRTGISQASRADGRRQPPPPIEIPQALDIGNADSDVDAVDRVSPHRPSRPDLHNHVEDTLSNARSRQERAEVHREGPSVVSALYQQLSIQTPAEADRLPSMTAGLQGELASQPDTPTTPTGPAQHPSPGRRRSGSAGSSGGRPFFRRQQSLSGESDEGHNDNDAVPFRNTGVAIDLEEPLIDIQSEMYMDDMTRRPILEAVESEEGLAAQNDRNVNVAHRSLDGSVIDAATTTTRTIDFTPLQPTFAVVNPVPEPAQPTIYPQSRMTSPGILASVPRDEDVIQSLQLLAYISKYCNLRSYFQQSHLVPKLKIGRELNAFDEGGNSESVVEEDNDDEYCQDDDYNIFPLVEKFTVRHHSHDMKYWAGVVMRNLCRKDKARGDIRQCAYYKCGRWEDYARQFAKCRRCRQTKYCSKDCQKSAWVYHRHWCQPVSQ